MAGKGSPKGVRQGGRKKGTPNKATVARNAKLAKSGMTPLEFMMQTMWNEQLDHRDRMYAANAAAPYMHPKLAQVEIGNKGGEAFKVILDGLAGGVL